MAYDLFSSRLDQFNSRGEFQAGALSRLQASGLINQSVMDKITAMATKHVARGVVLFGRVPNVLEVEFALLPE